MYVIIVSYKAIICYKNSNGLSDLVPGLPLQKTAVGQCVCYYAYKKRKLGDFRLPKRCR